MKNWDEKNLLRYVHPRSSLSFPLVRTVRSILQSQPPRRTRTRWEAILALQKPNDALKLNRDEILEQVSSQLEEFTLDFVGFQTISSLLSLLVQG